MQKERVIYLGMKKIDQLKWKEYSICEIFTILPGVRLTKADMIEGCTPFIGATDSNNGITTFCGNDNASRDYNVLGVNYNGSVVENFYHPYTALFSDDVKRLHLKNNKGNKYIYLFIKQCILKQKSKYVYGYKFNGERMKKQIILLPSRDNGEPDYNYMEEYMRHIERKLLQRYKKYLEYTSRLYDSPVDVEEKDWKSFQLETIGEVRPGRDIYEKERIEGKTPYVTATAQLNGIGYFVSNENDSLSFGCISVNRNGSVGYSFYHPYKALFGNDTRRLVPYNEYHYANFFLTQAIMKQKEKYGYGLKMGTERLKKQSIMLPINKKKEPDYVYMDQYMHNIEVRILSQYITKRLLDLNNDNI